MNLEEMLRKERTALAPNPLIERTDEIVSRVRRRRRGRVAAAGVVAAVALAVIGGLAGRLLPTDAELAPAETPPSDIVRLEQLPADAPLDPGRYVVTVSGELDNISTQPLLPVLSVPEGYAAIGGGIGVSAESHYLWVWDVERVHSHPCEFGTEIKTVGPSVADLANALAAQPLRAGPEAVPVTVGGYDGLYLELSVPTDADLEACPNEGFNIWPGLWQVLPGQVDMLWILDVEGQRIIFEAAQFPDARTDRVAELEEMVLTATFTLADDSR